MENKNKKVASANNLPSVKPSKEEGLYYERVFSSLLLGYCDAGKIRDLCPFNGLLSNKKAKSVADPCLTKTWDTNSKRIERGNFHCPNCNVCICFPCGIELLKKETYPASVPKCGEKLEDSLFRLKFYT